jgi:hypothetical protein
VERVVLVFMQYKLPNLYLVPHMLQQLQVLEQNLNYVDVLVPI